jgi:hypothetical protein
MAQLHGILAVTKANSEQCFQDVVSQRVSMIPDDDFEIGEDTLDGYLTAWQSEEYLSCDGQREICDRS